MSILNPIDKCHEGGEGEVVNISYKSIIKDKADEILALLEGWDLTNDQKLAIIRMTRQKLIDMNRTEKIEAIKNSINY
jgi:hypothetical protein